MEFETAYQRCLAECSIGGAGNEWKYMLFGILAIGLICIVGSISNRLTRVGRRYGGGVMSLLLVGAILAGVVAFLAPTLFAIEVSGVDPNKCNQECVHLIPAQKRPEVR